MAGHVRSQTSTTRAGCVILAALAVGLLLVGGGWFLLRPAPRPEGALPTAELWTATPSPVPTATPLPPVPPGVIGVGSRVRVVGTGAAGLSLRAAAGTQHERLDVAAEGESFIVAAGPVQADGYSWWLLRDEANPQREGWGVADYLTREQSADGAD